jgi:hypothetical protein
MITTSLLPEPEFRSLCDKLGLKTTAGRIALSYALENTKLLDTKHLDYGPMNIAFHGQIGVVSKLFDKVCRIKHLLSQKRRPRNESIKDSWMDISNYGVIGLMLKESNWPMNEEENTLTK